MRPKVARASNAAPEDGGVRKRPEGRGRLEVGPKMWGMRWPDMGLTSAQRLVTHLRPRLSEPPRFQGVADHWHHNHTYLGPGPECSDSMRCLRLALDDIPELPERPLLLPRSVGAPWMPLRV